MGITGLDGITILGILFEIVGFMFLLPGFREKIEQRFGTLMTTNTIKLKLGSWLRRYREALGIYLVMFGLALQIISLID